MIKLSPLTCERLQVTIQLKRQTQVLCFYSYFSTINSFWYYSTETNILALRLILFALKENKFARVKEKDLYSVLPFLSPHENKNIQ